MSPMGIPVEKCQPPVLISIQQTHLRFHFLVLVIICVIHAFTHALPYCNIQVVTVKQTVPNDTCNRQRIELAIRRHQTIIFGQEKPKEKFQLRCPVCGELNATRAFVWKFISRNSPSPIFRTYGQSAYDSSWVLDTAKMQDVTSVNPDNLCVHRTNNDLHIRITDVSKQAGTYVCTYPGDKNHPANYIWYHVDQIASHRSNSKAISVNVLSGLPNRVDNLEELKTIQAAVRHELASYPGWTDQIVAPFVMTSQLSEDEAFLDRCGPLTIRQDRRCYIRIPTERPKRYGLDELSLAYQLLRQAFNFLVSFRDANSWARGRNEQAARKRAKQLGFDIHGNGSYLYIPCEYGLFRHLYRLTERFREFPRTGYHVDVNYDVSCGQMSPLEMLEMARVSELVNVTVQLNEYEDYRYIKIQRLVTQGEKHLSLRCTSSTFGHPLRCNGSWHDVLWRSGNDLIFNERRTPTDNVYVSSDCELRFDEVHVYDLDIYYCYLRDPMNTYAVWSRKPRIAYRLQIAKTPFVWPRKNNILVGLIILISWSALLFVAWFVLNLYDATAREGAMFEASVKHAGGRMARLKMIYSPFSDEDRKLFFRMITNDLKSETS